MGSRHTMPYPYRLGVSKPCARCARVGKVYLLWPGKKDCDRYGCGACKHVWEVKHEQEDG